MSLVWTESADRSFDEVARLCSFLGVFALAIMTQGKEGLRHALGGIAAAIVVVAGFALLSRFEPTMFPVNDAANEIVRSRLSYPLNYWNGLATLMAIGVPLLIAIAVDTKRILTRAVATAALPLLALTLYFTYSRGGIIAVAIGLAILLALHPRRAAALVPVLLGGVGSVLVIVAASQRPEVANFLPEQIPNFPDDPFSFEQMSEEMIAVIAAVTLGIFLIAAAVGFADRFGVGPRIRVPRIPRAAVLGAVAVVAVVGGNGVQRPGQDR